MLGTTTLRFVLISTDRAMNSTNLMGATKRAAEMVLSMMAAEHPDTRFMTVRFAMCRGTAAA